MMNNNWELIFKQTNKRTNETNDSIDYSIVTIDGEHFCQCCHVAFARYMNDVLVCCWQSSKVTLLYVSWLTLVLCRRWFCFINDTTDRVGLSSSCYYTFINAIWDLWQLERYTLIQELGKIVPRRIGWVGFIFGRGGAGGVTLLIVMWERGGYFV